MQSFCSASIAKCNGVFHDPGGNTHCMTTSKHSSSCVCEQIDYEIIAMDPVGEAKVEDSWDADLKACCQYPAENCGWTSSITKSDSQTVSWSDTTEVGFHMTWNVKAGPALKLGEIGFEVKNSFTYGKTTTNTKSQTYSSGCRCDPDNCKGPLTKLNYQLKLVYSTQPVQITARKCGATKTLPGTVKTSQFVGEYQCLINEVDSCNKSNGMYVV